jgi:shikimate dehydrogenase
MQINKDTKIYGSFSSNPGNNGCIFFNKKFKENKMNAIYKSFYADNLLKTLEAVKTLNFSGFALSMPFKVEILKYTDYIDPIANEIGSANTILNISDELYAYNTDWLGVKKFFLNMSNKPKDILIAGNGGFSKAIQYTCNKININYKVITRENWSDLESTEKIIFNATPVELIYKNIIDGRPFAKDGKLIANFQAEEQFKLYTK